MRRPLFACLAGGLLVAGIVGVTARAGANDPAVVIVEPGQSIQAAIDAAHQHTTIVVRPGTYAENLLITTDRITLIGQGATLEPPVSPGPGTLCDFGGPEATNGICAAGGFDMSDPNAPPKVIDQLTDVTITGFTVQGFPGSGIVFLGARNPVVTQNTATGNGEYGIARFFSKDGQILGNTATGSAEAGIYVGDSPQANVLIAGNHATDNQLFGIFLRDARFGTVVGNDASGNCVGVIVIGNVSGNFTISGNNVHENNAFCPAGGEEGDVALSGIGIALASGDRNVVSGNSITGNVASQEVPFAGGLVMVDASEGGADPPSDNSITGNTFNGNQPDILTDGTGQRNVISGNACTTSVPDGLCAG
jgi:parallel beta-helix repeat protein